MDAPRLGPLKLSKTVAQVYVWQLKLEPRTYAMNVSRVTNDTPLARFAQMAGKGTWSGRCFLPWRPRSMIGCPAVTAFVTLQDCCPGISLAAQTRAQDICNERITGDTRYPIPL